MTRMTLNVTSQTTTADLNKFLDSADRGSKIRGKAVNGGYLIYAETKSSSTLDRIVGRARDRNKAGAEGINLVLKNFQASAERGGFPTTGNSAPTSAALFQNIGDTGTLSGRHALRSGTINDVAKNAALVEARLDLRTAHSPLKSVDVDGPKVPLNVDATQIKTMADGVQGAGDEAGRAKAVQAIATVITAILSSPANDKTTQLSLALSSGQHLKAEISEAIQSHLSKSGSAIGAQLEPLVSEAFEKAASQRLGTSQSSKMAALPPGGSIKEMPLIHIDGKDYTPTKELGKGGFGRVFLYANMNDKSETIAFKIPNSCLPTHDGEFSHVENKEKGDFIKEFLSHNAAASVGNDNILGLKGAVRLSNGVVGIALETAPNGDLGEGIEGLFRLNAGNANVFSKPEMAAIQLTLAQDCLNGLKALHDGGMLHFDFKLPNCLIGEGGSVKVMDFGTLETSTAISLKRFDPNIQNVAYLSPEYLDGKADLPNLRNEAKNDISKIVSSLLPAVAAKDRDKYVNNIIRGMTRLDGANDVDPNMIIDDKGRSYGAAHDTWGLGVALAEIFTGNPVLSDLSGISREDAIIAFGRDPANRAVAPNTTGPLPPNTLFHSTGHAVIDDLLNKLLMPDPAQRISLDDAAKHSAFQMPGVASDLTRSMVPLMTDAARLAKVERLEIGDQQELLQHNFDKSARIIRDNIASGAVATGVFDDQKIARLLGNKTPMSERQEIFDSLPLDKVPGKDGQNLLQYKLEIDTKEQRVAGIRHLIDAEGAKIMAAKGNFSESISAQFALPPISTLPPLPDRPVHSALPLPN